MGVQVTTRNNTRNQLTVDFQVKRFCIFDNQYIPVVLNNNTGATIVAQGGIFVVRNTAIADQVFPAIGNVGAPALPVLTGSDSGGTLAATTYYIKQTAITPYGESTGSAEANVTTSGSTSSILVTGTVVPGATSYRTYIGTSAGAEGQWFASSTPVITLTTATGTAGTVPTTDTTGNLANIIGILLFESSLSLANGSTAAGSAVISGCIDGSMVILPLNTTFDTVVGNKTFKDVLNAIGFKIDQSTVDNTKFDN